MFILTLLELQVFKLKLWVVKLCLSNCLILSKFILSYTVRRQNYIVNTSDKYFVQYKLSENRENAKHINTHVFCLENTASWNQQL